MPTSIYTNEIPEQTLAIYPRRKSITAREGLLMFSDVFVWL